MTVVEEDQESAKPYQRQESRGLQTVCWGFYFVEAAPPWIFTAACSTQEDKALYSALSEMQLPIR
jgi:hypothetical protein